MPDREKVIKGLTVCTEYGTPVEDCRKCPYQGEEYCTDAVMLDALALLREQEPVKPTEKNGWHYCGACGRLIDSDFADEEVFQYCPNCGRAVKWKND